MKAKYYIKEMRVHHYIKNFLIFLPLFCSRKMLIERKLLQTMLGFFVFCLCSSVVYIVNDIRDCEKDRKHPRKNKRPIAAGIITKKCAGIFAIVLFLILMACQILLLSNIKSGVLLLFYVLLNLGYSMGLKNFAIIDIVILVAGYVIRVMYGASIAEIDISSWLYLTVMSASFYLAFGKRRNEWIIQYDGGETRKVLQSYSENFLQQNMYVFLTLTNVFYSLWSMSERTKKLYNGYSIVWTVPFVVIICMKYSFNIEKNGDGDPIEILLNDKVLIILCLIYCVIMSCILYT